MRQITRWVKLRVWPWSKITRLEEELERSTAQIVSMLERDSSHHASWLKTANMFWGKQPFTHQQKLDMDSMYRQGYGWRQALDFLAIADRHDPRNQSTIPYDKLVKP